jgi:hypothetical protein
VYCVLNILFNDLGGNILLPLPHLIDHPEELFPAFQPCFQVPERHDCGHRLPGPPDDVLIPRQYTSSKSCQRFFLAFKAVTFLTISPTQSIDTSYD